MLYTSRRCAAGRPVFGRFADLHGQATSWGSPPRDRHIEKTADASGGRSPLDSPKSGPQRRRPLSARTAQRRNGSNELVFESARRKDAGPDRRIDRSSRLVGDRPGRCPGRRAPRAHGKGNRCRDGEADSVREHRSFPRGPTRGSARLRGGRRGERRGRLISHAAPGRVLPGDRHARRVSNPAR